MKKRCSKILALFCAASLVLSLFGAVPSAAAAGDSGTVTEGVYTGRVNEDGASVTLLTMTSALEKDLKLPAVLGGLPVTAIGPTLFSGPGGYSMETAVIPASIRKIDPFAFAGYYARTLREIQVERGNTAFEAVDGVLFAQDEDHTLVAYPRGKAGASYSVPADVRAIGERAFSGAAFSSVNLPEGLQSIGGGAFNSSGLTSIALPSTVTEVGESVFSSCTSLEEVTLSMEQVPNRLFYLCTGLKKVTLAEGVKVIGEETFTACDRLETFVFPSTLEVIGKSSFSSCKKLTSLSLNEGLKSIGDGAFRSAGVKSVTFPTTLVSIGSGAFSGSALEALEIPSSVTDIGNDAFNGTKITEVTFPATVTNAGTALFAYCKNLVSATVEDGVTVLPNSLFSNCEALTTVKLPDGLKSIGSGAFRSCAALDSIQLPATVTELGSSAFAGCPLRSIQLPDGIAKIQTMAFQNCTKLQTVEFPRELTSIASCSFQRCLALQSVTLPSKVESIDALAFEYCNALYEVILQGNAPAKTSRDPFPKNEGRSIYRPSRAAGYDAAPWNSMGIKDIAERPGTVEKKPIEIKLTSHLSHSRQDELILWLTMDVTPRLYSEEEPILPSGGVNTYIQVQGAGPETQPEAIYYQGGNTSTFRTFGYNMEKYAGKDVSVYVTMDESIGFEQGTSNVLTGHIYRLDELLWDEDRAFGDSEAGYRYDPEGGVILNLLSARDAAASSVELPQTVNGTPVTALDWGLFMEHSQLASVSIPDTVTSIGSKCFYGCRSLQEITLPASLTRINLDAFRNSGLQTVTLLGDAPVLDRDKNPFPEGVRFTVPENASGYDAEPWKTILGKEQGGQDPSPDVTPAPSPDVTPAPSPDVTPSPSPDVTPVPKPDTRPDGGSTPDPVPMPEPSAPVVEVSKAPDGTVSTTTIWPDGKAAVAVKTPEGDKNIVVTTAEGQELAKVVLPSEPGPAKDFADVQEDDWYRESVQSASALGLFSGTEENTFSPQSPLTRGMLVTTLHRLSGQVDYGVGERCFEDVQDGVFYADAADWAKAAGIAEGKDSGFDPNGNITREQLVTMLYRYADVLGAAKDSSASLTEFPDSGSVSGYAEKAMEWAVAEGLIQGKDGKIVPKGDATRAEVAAVLTRFVDYLAQ